LYKTIANMLVTAGISLW